ncbi:PIN domain nuclease [Cyclobacterium sp.]|uniref:type II toxin-antitoxin system VapC family toxin n=1 Tax=Cyclobacterium sp. TaxID=1966343 RepID=UPI0019859848|nr:PIN domain nuclease [Cyclobacterium sp.]MBD3628230.1 PIN domain nuclease [Cyclobacterium sp.]
MILVDSSVWIDFFNGVDAPHVEKLYQLLGKEPVATGDLIVVEILQGFHNEHHFQQAKQVLKEMPFFSLCNKELSIITAENYRTLRRKGITIRKTIDMVIGTFCIENNMVLLHKDKDFKPLEIHLGLQVMLY